GEPLEIGDRANLFATKRFGEPLEVGDRRTSSFLLIQIEPCSFYISREQAERLHWSISVIKSSQQGLILIFKELLLLHLS
ncbi:TPA: hypothetical protein ACGPA6_001391, partial [Streptococcus suis]